MIRALVEPILERAKELKVKVAGIGLGVAGVIDYAEDKMLASPNIPIIDNVKLSAKVEEMMGIPTNLMMRLRTPPPEQTIFPISPLKKKTPRTGGMPKSLFSTRVIR